MHYKIILSALVENLGGSGEDFEKELDELIGKYPNFSLLLTDVFKNGAMLTQEIEELHHKVEILKNCLVEHKLLVSIPAPDNASEMTREQVEAYVKGHMEEKEEPEEIKIGDIVWHLACDEENPN